MFVIGENVKIDQLENLLILQTDTKCYEINIHDFSINYLFDTNKNEHFVINNFWYKLQNRQLTHKKNEFQNIDNNKSTNEPFNIPNEFTTLNVLYDPISTKYFLLTTNDSEKTLLDAQNGSILHTISVNGDFKMYNNHLYIGTNDKILQIDLTTKTEKIITKIKQHSLISILNDQIAYTQNKTIHLLSLKNGKTSKFLYHLDLINILEYDLFDNVLYTASLDNRIYRLNVLTSERKFILDVLDNVLEIKFNETHVFILTRNMVYIFDKMTHSVLKRVVSLSSEFKYQGILIEKNENEQTSPIHSEEIEFKSIENIQSKYIKNKKRFKCTEQNELENMEENNPEKNLQKALIGTEQIEPKNIKITENLDNRCSIENHVFSHKNTIYLFDSISKQLSKTFSNLPLFKSIYVHNSNLICFEFLNGKCKFNIYEIYQNSMSIVKVFNISICQETIKNCYFHENCLLILYKDGVLKKYYTSLLKPKLENNILQVLFEEKTEWCLKKDGLYKNKSLLYENQDVEQFHVCDKHFFIIMSDKIVVLNREGSFVAEYGMAKVVYAKENVFILQNGMVHQKFLFEDEKFMKVSETSVLESFSKYIDDKFFIKGDNEIGEI